MRMRNIFLVIAVLLTVFAVESRAQDKLGDFVAEYGYDWLIGNWAATSDDGQQVELEYRWILDKYAMRVNLKMGDFKYHGMIMFVQPREEIIQIGADNMGGTWNGTWTEDYEGAVNRNKRLEPYGGSETMDMVFVKINNDSFKVKEYSVESGYRSSSARGETTFKRQKADAVQKADMGSELEGTWVGSDAGSYGDVWTFVISKGKVEVKGPDYTFYSGTVTINDKTNPKQAEFKIEKCSMSEYVGETALSIYKLEGKKKLTLAASEPGSLYRPTYFDSGGGVMLFTLTKR